jgi:hypothetical protein
LGNNENLKRNLSRTPNLEGIKARYLGPSHWLKGKQILPPPPHHNLKGNRPRHPESMIVPSYRLDEISLHLKS